MFSLRKPSQSSIQRGLATAKSLPLNYGIPLNTQCGPDELNIPRGYALDHTRSQIGRGPNAFEAAKSALRRWHHFDLGWVRVANPAAAIEIGEIVAVEVRALGLWSLNLSR